MRMIVTAAVAGAAVMAVAGSAFGYAALDKDVQLSVDGASSEVSTMAGTVGEVLQSRGIELSEHDLVRPALNTRLSDGTRIDVQYGRQIRVTVDGQQQTFWTTATRVDDALRALDLQSAGAELSTSRSTRIGRGGLSFNLATRKTITINDAGTAKKITTTAQTVGAALSAARIDLDRDDVLSVREETPLRDGSSFSVTKVDVLTVTKKQRVAFKTTYRKSDRLDQGQSQVDAEGRPGVRETEVREVWHNGKLQSREQTASRLARAPRTKIVLLGTREPDAKPEPQPRDAAGTGKSNGDSSENTNENQPKNNAESNPENSDNEPDSTSEPKSGNETRNEPGNNADNPTDSQADNADNADNKADNADNNTGNGADRDAVGDGDDATTGDDQGDAKTGDGNSEKGDGDSGDGENDSVWDRLAECESGQRWDIDSDNGFYGGLQFARRSWRAYGGTKYAPLASEATREQQIAIAEKIRDDVGWRAWPACSRKLGLR